MLEYFQNDLQMEGRSFRKAGVIKSEAAALRV
jgi:hypothetical protein